MGFPERWKQERMALRSDPSPHEILRMARSLLGLIAVAVAVVFVTSSSHILVGFYDWRSHLGFLAGKAAAVALVGVLAALIRHRFDGDSTGFVVGTAAMIVFAWLTLLAA